MPRYHNNAKQVLRDGKHFADCIDDGAARLVAEALNERKGMPQIQQSLPLDGADGPLFIGDRAPPRSIQYEPFSEEKHGNLNWVPVLDPTPRPNHYRVPPKLPHTVRQENDEYACSCGARWDVADGEDHP